MIRTADVDLKIDSIHGSGGEGGVAQVVKVVEWNFEDAEVQLWWPVGYGNQHLYTVEVILLDQVGFRYSSCRNHFLTILHVGGCYLGFEISPIGFPSRRVDTRTPRGGGPVRQGNDFLVPNQRSTDVHGRYVPNLDTFLPRSHLSCSSHFLTVCLRLELDPGGQFLDHDHGREVSCVVDAAERRKSEHGSAMGWRYLRA